jgi:hypothetical protein
VVGGGGQQQQGVGGTDSTQAGRIWNNLGRQKVERGLLVINHILWYRLSFFLLTFLILSQTPTPFFAMCHSFVAEYNFLVADSPSLSLTAVLLLLAVILLLLQ